MNIHFISIGGSAMHNLALTLHDKGDKITGSDDDIFEPSKSRLAAKGLLPKKMGWFEKNIHKDLIKAQCLVLTFKKQIILNC